MTAQQYIQTKPEAKHSTIGPTAWHSLADRRDVLHTRRHRLRQAADYPSWSYQATGQRMLWQMLW